MSQKQITIVVAVITNDAGNVLLAKRNQPQTPEIHGKWEFVGGGIDFGEDPTESIKREAKEEIGVEIEVVRLLPKVISDLQKFNNGDEWQVLVLSYECRIISGIPKPSDKEISEVKFFPIDDIKNLDAFQNIHETIELL
jgi:8-oxo-dGTP pyrophosphatase MutT (NUDIX family)